MYLQKFASYKSCVAYFVQEKYLPLNYISFLSLILPILGFLAFKFDVHLGGKIRPYIRENPHPHILSILLILVYLILLTLFAT